MASEKYEDLAKEVFAGLSPATRDRLLELLKREIKTAWNKSTESPAAKAAYVDERIKRLQIMIDGGQA